MFILRLFIYLKGYVTLNSISSRMERFFNICCKRGLIIWNIKKIHPNITTFNISSSDLSKVNSIADKTNTDIKIINKKGLYFKLVHLKYRIAFLLGPLIFFFIIYSLTSFIWSINIFGKNTLKTEYILQKLEEQGIKEGVLKYEIDTKHLANYLMFNVKELAWVSVSINGTNLKISIAERKPKPNILQKDIPCSIIASRDALIKKMIVKSGVSLVKNGDTVQKGDLLVSGEIINKKDNSKIRLVHVLADIEATTWYEERVKVKYTKETYIYSGNSKSFYSLKLFSKNYSLNSGDVPYFNYDVFETKKKLSLGSDFMLPIGLIINKYSEKKNVTLPLSENEAKKQAVNEALKKLEAIMPKNAIKNNTVLNFIKTNDNEEFVVVVIECTEDIGEKIRIGGN